VEDLIGRIASGIMDSCVVEVNSPFKLRIPVHLVIVNVRPEFTRKCSVEPFVDTVGLRVVGRG